MAGCARGPLGLVVFFPRRGVEGAGRGAFVMLIDWGCAQEARRSDGAPLVSCGRWRRPGEDKGSGEVVRGFRTARACGFGDPFAVSCSQVSRRSSSQAFGRDVEELPPAAACRAPLPEPTPRCPHRLRGAGAKPPDPCPGLRAPDR